MKTEKNEHKGRRRDKPPFFSSWNRLYAFVLLNLAVLIILFYLFTKAFE
jgi:hypothetical protein